MYKGDISLMPISPTVIITLLFLQLFTAIYLRFYLPVNRLHTVCFQKFICLTERLAPEESAICGKRTWMRRLQNQMIRIIQHCRFALRRSPHRIKTMGRSCRFNAIIAASVNSSHPIPRCELASCARTVRTVFSISTPCSAHFVRYP